MKWMIAVALLTVAGSLPARTAPAQAAHEHHRTVLYLRPTAPLTMVCNVDGTDYQVDITNQIWSQNVTGKWFILGRIVTDSDGTFAEMTDGLRVPASC
jgi:hypothetical protein